jgi:hypothetical protein
MEFFYFISLWSKGYGNDFVQREYALGSKGSGDGSKRICSSLDIKKKYLRIILQYF